MPIPSAKLSQSALNAVLAPGLGPTGAPGAPRDLGQILAGELLLLRCVQPLVQEALGDLDRELGRDVLDLVHGLRLLVLDLPQRIGLLGLGFGPRLGDQLVAQLLHVLGVAPHHLRRLGPGLLDGFLLLGEETLGLGTLALRRLDRRSDGLLPLVHHLEDGPPRHSAEQQAHQDEGDQRPEDEAGTNVYEVGGGEDDGHGECLWESGARGAPTSATPGPEVDRCQPALVARRMLTTRPNRPTPSMSAAAMSMVVRML